MYVGRTRDPDAREKAHSYCRIRGHLQFYSAHTNLTYVKARVLEQTEMISYHTLNALHANNDPARNQIRGVGPRNPDLHVYAEASRNIIDNQLWNEFLNAQERNN